VLDNQWGGFSWEVTKGVNQSAFETVQIQYPAVLGSPEFYRASVAAGVAAGANVIRIVARSQVGIICNEVGDQPLSEIRPSMVKNMGGSAALGGTE
jgi:hypothetical protein